MATVSVTPEAKKTRKGPSATKQARKLAKAAKEAKQAAKPATSTQPKEVAYNGFCIARTFATKLTEAQAALDSAKANDKDGNFRWSIYTITKASKSDSPLPSDDFRYSDENGYAVAVGFDRSAVKAEAMLKAAQKHGKFYALKVLATADHAKGTKQAKLAAKE